MPLLFLQEHVEGVLQPWPALSGELGVYKVAAAAKTDPFQLTSNAVPKTW